MQKQKVKYVKTRNRNDFSLCGKRPVGTNLAQQNREIESNFKTRWKSLIRERYNISSTFSAHFCAYHSTGRITQRVAIVPWNVPKEGQVPSGFLARRRRRQHNAFSRHFTGSRHYSALRRRNLCILTTVFSNGFPASLPRAR